MAIEEYFSQVKAVVDKYVAASFVASTNIAFETRPAEQGFLSGTVQFVDGSTLRFREYLDAIRETIQKVMYSYHYQSATAQMILRYDNSAHRPTLASVEHKHDASGVKETNAPTLEDVLAEIAEMRHWM